MPVVHSSSRKLRVQRKDKIITFVGGTYYYMLDEKKELFAILRTVSPKEAIITDQMGERINKEKPVFTVKKSTETKAKKVREVKDANTIS